MPNFQDVITKFSKAVIFLGLMNLALLGIIVYLVFFKPTAKEEEEAMGFCGVIDMEAGLLEDRAVYRRAANYLGHDFNPEKGRFSFRQNCSACHTRNSMRMVGPGLNNLFSRIPDGEWLMNYMFQKDSLALVKSPYYKLLKKEFPDKFHHKELRIYENEVYNTLGYLKMLDEAK